MKLIVLEVSKHSYLCKTEAGAAFTLDKNALPSALKSVVQKGDVIILNKKIEVDKLVS